MRISRRSMIAGSAALLAACGRTPERASPEAVRTGEGRLIDIRGKQLFVETWGDEKAPPLLYLHGGPGAGAYDFAVMQGERLSKDLRLVLLDQRGVLRSDPITPEEPFGLADLVEDCEALRLALGLERWSVLGHSFGGYLAVCYALAYPGAIERALYENPTFDLETSARHTLRAAAREFDAAGDEAGAREAREAAEAPGAPAEVWSRFNIINKLGDGRDNLYVHGPDKQFFPRLIEESGLGDKWGRGATQQRRLYQEGRVFESLLPRLAGISLPSLLLKGRSDYVTSPEQIAAFEAAGGRTVYFEESSHFARFEEPELYARMVAKFVKSGEI